MLHVISGLFYGGGQRVVLDLLRAQSQAENVQSQLCTLGSCDGSPLTDWCDASVEYDGRYNNPIVLFGSAKRLRRAIRKTGVEILHTHGLDADLIGALAVRGTQARHVCHLHITPPRNRRESFKAAIRRKLLRYLTGRNRSWFIAVSDAVREQMIEYYGLPGERVVTVRNGIDFAEFGKQTDANDRPANRVVFGTAARLAPMKGLEHLIAAAVRLQEQGVDFELRIAGTGSLKEKLEGLASSSGIGERVSFVGHVSDMPAFYQELNAFVLPSRTTEGLPLVVLEAMSAGVPVIATTVGGTPEVFRSEDEGLLVPPGDEDALAAALTRLANDDALRRQIGQSGRERVMSDFCIDRVSREVSKVYERVLEDSRKS